MSTINKADATKGRVQYHLRLKPGDVGKYALLPGDPDRLLRWEDAISIALEGIYRYEHNSQ